MIRTLSAGTTLVCVLAAHGQCEPSIIEIIDTPESATVVALTGTLAVVNSGYGVTVIDVADPAAPALLATVPTPGIAYDVAASGDVAYVACLEAGLQVIDLSNPEAPVVIGSVDTPAAYVAVRDLVAYVWGAGAEGWLKLIDVADPPNPTLKGAVAVQACTDIAVGPGLAVVANWFGVEVIDVEDPTAPAIVGSISGLEWASSVVINGAFAYLGIGFMAGGVHVVDISNPSTPAIVGTVITPYTNNRMAVSGDTLFGGTYAESGLEVIDVSNPTDPMIIGFVDTPGIASDVAVSGNVAYVAASSGGLLTVDVSSCVTPCDADLDGDGDVGVTDLTFVILAWGQAGVAADINGDGVVDVLDLIQVITNWGPCV